MLRHRFAKETRDLEMQKLVGLKSLDIAVYRIIYLGFVSLFFFSHWWVELSGVIFSTYFSHLCYEMIKELSKCYLLSQYRRV